MVLFLWSVILVSLASMILLRQIATGQQSLLTNLAVLAGLSWSSFILQAREAVRVLEILLIELAVKLLDVLAYFQGYTVKIADGSILEQVYRLRYQVYLDTGYIQENEHQLFMDEDDYFATNLVVMKQNDIIACLKIMFSNGVKKLSTLNYYNIDIPSQDIEQYVDIGRWVVNPTYRAKKTKNPIVTILIGLKTYVYLLKTQKKYIIVIMKGKLREHIEKIFNVKFVQPRLLPFTTQNENSRKKYKGYFEKNPDIEVSILQLKIRYLFQFIFRY